MMPTDASTDVSTFSDVIWRDVLPPEKHPGFKYEGFTPGKVVDLPKGHILRPGYGAFRLDVTLGIDIKVPMRDGVNLYTNVFRPTHPEPARLPALIAWSPYGKCAGGTGPQNYDRMGPFRMGIDYQRLSGYETFEGPNPAEWCERGYVVVNPDARGACHSEGDIHIWGQQEAVDIYDLIDWCSKQDWCNGNVVMFGNSWLAVSQINHAARCRHPALKAIAPWEAMTDIYMDTCCRGGVIVNNDVLGNLIRGGFAGLSQVEDIWSMPGSRPLYDDYWKSKHIDVEKLDIPLYLTASYSTGLHSRGSFETFSKAKSKDKWLRVHTSQEWHDLYLKKNMDELQKFYDHYAKGKTDRGWLDTPRLRLSLIGMSGSITSTISERPEPDSTFPLARTKNTKFYLNASSMTANNTQPSTESKTSYEGHSFTGQAVFNMKFDKYTELFGLPWIKLHMSCQDKDDMDIHIMIRKTNISGDLLEHPNYPMPAPIDQIPHSNVAIFQGPNGILRASHCVSQNPKAHSDDAPSYTHETRESIEPGTVVALEIPIWPIGMVFEAGEGIAVVIAGHDLRLPEVLIGDRPAEPNDQNIGRHVIHCGGRYDSFVMLPFIT